jgi:hypothetical protein
MSRLVSVRHGQRTKGIRPAKIDGAPGEERHDRVSETEGKGRGDRRSAHLRWGEAETARFGRDTSGGRRIELRVVPRRQRLGELEVSVSSRTER